ncbi:MAG: tetratricopeptide repeat protein, partial [Pseudomonadota bacterium]|nr:tetratricopeptide repeat protein [Pseudomonadota bacterium]
MSPNDKEINDAIMLYEKALVHQQSGEIDNAIKCYKDAISKNPNLWQAQNNLANLILYKGEYDEAIYLYKKALELDSENPIIQNNIGNVLIGQRKFQEAKKWFSKSLKKDPN